MNPSVGVLHFFAELYSDLIVSSLTDGEEVKHRKHLHV